MESDKPKCVSCDAEMYQYMDDEKYEYFKCPECGNKIKVPK
jgi:predicted RNA-binding Zn-ribbon protein involved in translation (DUF1610 family)